jgi:hypothetical protein
MRLKPLVENRSRKVLPRLAIVAPDDTVELINPAVGVGDGDGVGDGEGVGVGEAVGVGVGEAVGVGVGDGDADWACAADIVPIASTKIMATSRATARPALILCIREARDEQRINFFPEKSARSKKIAEITSAGRDLRPVRAERQSVAVPIKDRIEAVVVRRPQVA